MATNDEKIVVSKVLVERALMYGDNLVQAGEGLLAALNNRSAAEEAGFEPDNDAVTDFWNGLRSAAYYYDKHAAALKKAIADAPDVFCNDPLCDDALTDRDRYHDVADELADAIAKHFDVEIGEHSNMNCPWENALAWISPISFKVVSDAPPECVCGQKLENWDYCPNCGQHIEWEGV